MDFEEGQTSDGIMAYRALRTSVTEADKEAVVSALSRLTWRRTLRLVRATYTDLVAPRPTNNLPAINVAMGEFAARIAMQVVAGSGPLWRLAASAPEYQVRVGKVWRRTSVSFQAINNAKVIVERSAGPRAAIAAELAGRRWPK